MTKPGPQRKMIKTGRVIAPHHHPMIVRMRILAVVLGVTGTNAADPLVTIGLIILVAIKIGDVVAGITEDVIGIKIIEIRVETVTEGIMTKTETSVEIVLMDMEVLRDPMIVLQMKIMMVITSR